MASEVRRAGIVVWTHAGIYMAWIAWDAADLTILDAYRQELTELGVGSCGDDMTCILQLLKGQKAVERANVQEVHLVHVHAGLVAGPDPMVQADQPSCVNLQPQLASVTFATNNPTLTTVALEKPLCVFDSSAALDGAFEVYLYVLVDSASSRNASVQDAKTPLSSTFQQTEGGRTGPYKAAAFDLIPCGDLPSLDAIGDVARASEILDAYLVKVGANGTCLSDPNFHGLCNPPLSAATEYRWVWAAVGFFSQLLPPAFLALEPAGGPVLVSASVPPEEELVVSVDPISHC
ncbi:uroplakin-3a [Puma concolor]|uniref:Uroplakin-3a n=1 Tax=Puma concolor TaxID=9696 RepID=A0A6P6I2H4_PUMCO|nr:uroplakin-3a [Puma concolor]